MRTLQSLIIDSFTAKPSAMSSTLSFSYSRSQCTPCTAFYILNALPKAEASAGKKTWNDVLDGLLAQDGIDNDRARTLVTLLECADRAAFNAAIARIKKEARAGNRPMIFVHGHGEEKSGLQLASGTYVPWSAYLEALGSVMRASHGELTVIAAFCHSMSPIKTLPSTGRLPFAFYYGYDGTITAGEVDDETSQLYKGFLRDGGKAGPLEPTSLKSYSEYDHITPVMHQFKRFYGGSVHGEGAYPTLSIRQTIRKVEEFWPGMTLGGTSSIIKEVIQTRELVATMLDKFMYNTARRRRLIAEILDWKKQVQQGTAASVIQATE